MKKLLLLMLVVVISLIVTSAFAQGSWKDLFIKSPSMMKADQPGAELRSIFDPNLPLPINLTGDTLYLADAETWGIGVGIDVASWKGLITLRAEASASDTEAAFVGVGAFLNIPKAISMLSGTEWNAAFINPSVGVVPGYDFGANKFDVGLVLSIIQVTF